MNGVVEKIFMENVTSTYVYHFSDIISEQKSI